MTTGRGRAGGAAAAAVTDCRMSHAKPPTGVQGPGSMPRPGTRVYGSAEGGPGSRGRSPSSLAGTRAGTRFALRSSLFALRSSLFARLRSRRGSRVYGPVGEGFPGSTAQLERGKHKRRPRSHGIWMSGRAMEARVRVQRGRGGSGLWSCLTTVGEC